MNITPEKFLELLNKPAIKRRNQADSQGTHPIPKCPTGYKPIPPSGDERSHPTKFLVSVTSFRRRLLDEDNLVAKWHVDALRYAGILPSDAPDQAKISVGQEKVKTEEEECTVITIEKL